MGDTRDRMGAAGVAVAGGFFKIALYVCVAVLIIWIGKVTYQFGYDIFNQHAMSPGEGQEVTVVIKEDATSYDIARTLKSKGLIDDALVFVVQGKIIQLQRQNETGNLSLKYRVYTEPNHGYPCRRCRAGRSCFVIVEERMRTYINSLDTGNTPFLEELERYALENEVPIIRREMQSFMKVLLAVKRPLQVLEVGTADGLLHASYVRIRTAGYAHYND